MSSSQEPQPLTFDARGQSVAYLKEGSGPALAIVHALGGHKEDFKVVMQILSSHYTVYALPRHRSKVARI